MKKKETPEKKKKERTYRHKYKSRADALKCAVL